MSPPSSRLGAVIGVVVLLVGVASVLLVGLLIWSRLGGNLGDLFNRGDATAEAKVGDCIAELPRAAGKEAEPTDDVRLVRCSTPEAAYQVVGRVRDAAAARDRSAYACEPYFHPGDDSYVLYRVGDDGDGYLLCLVRGVKAR
ncbi:porin [Micromonospora sp. NPDC048999]|uniref:LppU/SCO3897 family protein n=1 Tax=Micromonospora sp. NPDC048999 TaxID=3155391 RepID=UPI0033C2779A